MDRVIDLSRDALSRRSVDVRRLQRVRRRSRPSLIPNAVESTWRQLDIPDRVRDRLVTQLQLDLAQIAPLGRGMTVLRVLILLQYG